MLLPTATVATILQCNKETVRRAVRAKRLKAMRTAAGMRIDSADLGVAPAVLAPLLRQYQEELAAAADRQLLAEKLFS